MGQELGKLADKHGEYVPELNEELTEPYPLGTGGVFIPMSPYTGDLPLQKIPQIVLNAGMTCRQYQDCIYEINVVSIKEYSRVRRSIQRLEKGMTSWEVYKNNLDRLIFGVTQICQDLNFFILENFNIVFIPYISVLRDETNGQHFGIIIDWKNRKKMEKRAKKFQKNAIKQFAKQQQQEKKQLKKSQNKKENKDNKPNKQVTLFECFCLANKRKKNNKDERKTDENNSNIEKELGRDGQGKTQEEEEVNGNVNGNGNEGMGGTSSVTNSEINDIDSDDENEANEMYDDFELSQMDIKDGLVSTVSIGSIGSTYASEMESNVPNSVVTTSGCTTMTSVTSVTGVASVASVASDSEAPLTLMIGKKLNLVKMKIRSTSATATVSATGSREGSVEPVNENGKTNCICNSIREESEVSSYTASNASKFGLTIYLPRHVRGDA